MKTNPAREALTRAINKAIANGAPRYIDQPTPLNAWMAKVDAILIRKCGLDSRDLVDWDYTGAFEDGMSPAEAAKAAREDAE